MIDLTILRYFVSVCENNNMTRVSEQMFISRQAVSKALHRLENTVGARLPKGWKHAYTYAGRTYSLCSCMCDPSGI
ncbi:MAG: LysR family transcriptional regulator [Clostridia bacterium]|nr:LysR family transcriptional regulator [Clostridia bacterium]